MQPALDPLLNDGREAFRLLGRRVQQSLARLGKPSRQLGGLGQLAAEVVRQSDIGQGQSGCAREPCEQLAVVVGQLPLGYRQT